MASRKSSGDLTAGAQQAVDSGTKSTDPLAVKSSVDKAAGGTAAVSAAVAAAAKTAADVQKQIDDAQGLLDSVKKGSGPTADALAKQGVVEIIGKSISDLKQALSDAQKIADSAKDKMSAVNDIVAKAKAATDKWPDPAAAQKSIDSAKASLADLCNRNCRTPERRWRPRRKLPRMRSSPWMKFRKPSPAFRVEQFQPMPRRHWTG